MFKCKDLNQIRNCKLIILNVHDKIKIHSCWIQNQKPISTLILNSCHLSTNPVQFSSVQSQYLIQPCPMQSYPIFSNPISSHPIQTTSHPILHNKIFSNHPQSNHSSHPIPISSHPILPNKLPSHPNPVPPSLERTLWFLVQHLSGSGATSRRKRQF